MNASSSAGCEFRFTSFVRHDFAVETTLTEVNDTFTKVIDTYNVKTNGSFSNREREDAQEDLRKHLNKLVDSSCDESMEGGLSITDDSTGETVWNIAAVEEGKYTECMGNETYNDAGK